jgi:5-phospho-D-xylono-1,4-lactonase
VDAHVHIWAKLKEPVKEKKISADCNFQLIKENLLDFKKSGGGLVIDCTPHGCGRDGNRLYRFSVETGVGIVCVTGFHKREYYFSSPGIWDFNKEEAYLFFLEEITEGLKETFNMKRRIKPGLIKIPFLGSLDGAYRILTDAAILAAAKTGKPLLIHTEQGLNIEWFSDYLEEKGIKPQQVVLSHMDKKPDIKLHQKLAAKGYYLEYDTFLREKYNPEKYTYNLIDLMAASGFGDSIMVGSDISDNNMWENIKAGAGYGSFFTKLKSRLSAGCNFSSHSPGIMGRNAARFLSGQ